MNLPDRGRGLRQKNNVSYNISDDDDDLLISEPPTPETPARRVANKYPNSAPPERISSAGHGLRPQRSLNLSLKAYENGDQPRKRVKYEAPRKRNVKNGPSSRAQIRSTIASETVANRHRFFVEKKDYFLPLLPESNFIQKLASKAEENKNNPEIIDLDEDSDVLSTAPAPRRRETVPYKLLGQPKGVKAVMKPYQLSGLSFLVYMFKNGVPCLLGDEMGLGKTLQTLALLQYIKENVKPSSGESRPSLVVCPLSVLSSWMTEAKRWTPNLKVLRFHGPVDERSRLKSVADGSMTMYGQETRHAKKKRNIRRTAAGKDVISLDSSDEEEDTAGYDVIVTSYETFQSEQGWFKRAFVWRYVVLDEGHKIKNELSNVSKALQGLSAEHALLLSGTPLQNNLGELWALLHWLYPEVFTERTAELFKEAFNLTRGKVSTPVMDNSRKLLELIMLRRMKHSPGVDLNLPPKTDVLLYVPLTPMQRFWYQRLLTRADKGLLEDLFKGAKDKAEVDRRKIEAEEAKFKLEELAQVAALDQSVTKTDAWAESRAIMQRAVEADAKEEKGKSAWNKLMNLLMQLRKVCNHPYLIPSNEALEIGEHIVTASGKFLVLDKLVQELVIKQRKKILIFSGFTAMLDNVEDFLSLRGGNGENFKYCRLDGSTPRARRNLGIRLFNDVSSEYRIMLISTRAGGLGLNLTAASDLVMLDQDWNPQITLQAEARAHRIGQKNPVTVYKLCTQGTVEEQMMGRIQKKLYLSAKVTESMKDIHTKQDGNPKAKGGRPSETSASEEMPNLDVSQLMTLVRRGAQTLARPEIDIDEMLSWDWVTTLEKCKDKAADVAVTEMMGAKVESAEDAEKNWLAQMEQVESRVFGGKNYGRERATYSDIQHEWKAREERRVDKNTTVMVDGYAVSKESMRCADWEAVPTMAGKDPRLAEVKRAKKAPMKNEGHCVTCFDGGDIIMCEGCPRSYHYKCLAKVDQARSKGFGNYHCTQHQCFDCQQKTGNAGGMLYRCRWCERAFCEDCMDWDNSKLIGETLPEFEVLDYGAVEQAFYVSCSHCEQQFADHAESKEYCDLMALEYEEEYKKFIARKQEEEAALISEEESKLPSRAESLTDGATIDDSGINTPRSEGISSPRLFESWISSGKRKAASNVAEDENMGSIKRPRRSGLSQVTYHDLEG